MEFFIDNAFPEIFNETLINYTDQLIVTKKYPFYTFLYDILKVLNKYIYSINNCYNVSEPVLI